MDARAENAEPPPVGRAERVFSVLMLLLMTAGFLPAVALMSGHPFLPSTSHYQAWSKAAFYSAFVVFIAAIWAILFTPFLKRTRAKSPIARRFAAFGIPFFFALVAPFAFIFAYPMLCAMLVGEAMHLTYTVKDPTGRSDRKCHPKVKLVSMPFVFGDVCHVPEEFRSQLRPGMQIELGGRGTEYGLFYDSIRIPESGLSAPL